VAGTNGEADHSEVNGGDLPESNGAATKKKKSKGAHLQTASRYKNADDTTQVDSARPCGVHNSDYSHSNSCLTGKKKKVQTEPPTVPIAELFAGGIAPEGEWQSYKDEYVHVPTLLLQHYVYFFFAPVCANHADLSCTVLLCAVLC